MSRILIASDMAFMGSGYKSIVENLASGLCDLGHQVMVIGFRYQGEEHNFPFSMVQASDFRDLFNAYHNLVFLWKPDVFICAFDVPIQIKIKYELNRMKEVPKIPYIGIAPLESGPLNPTWAMNLMQMDKLFMISDFATKECERMHVDAEHLQVGIDTVSWRMPTKEERRKARLDMFGIEDDDTFVVLTVADNQERKNLSGGMKIVGKFAELYPNTVYVLVTRKNFEFGWLLDDEAIKRNLMGKFQCFDRGIPTFPNLWSIYAGADCFLLPSKAEGLGMPILEAMSVGIPVVGTDCGAIHELLEDDRGWLVQPEYVVDDDPFGNTNRYFISIDDAVFALEQILSDVENGSVIESARKYVEGRTHGHSVQQLDQAIKEVLNGKE